MAFYTGGIPAEVQESTTVNLDNSMTTADIQAEIDALKKYIPFGETVNIQFADGTYVATAGQGIDVSGFYGGGSLEIQGNLSEPGANTTHSNQLVILDCVTNGGGASGIYIHGNMLAYIRVRNVRVNFDATNQHRGIYAYYNGGVIQIATSSTLGDLSTGGIGVWVAWGTYAKVNNMDFSNSGYGLYVSEGARVYSAVNGSFGTNPNYGIAAQAGGTIYKNGSQPTGATANEQTATGGSIIA